MTKIALTYLLQKAWLPKWHLEGQAVEPVSYSQDGKVLRVCTCSFHVAVAISKSSMKLEMLQWSIGSNKF